MKIVKNCKRKSTSIQQLIMRANKIVLVIAGTRVDSSCW